MKGRILWYAVALVFLSMAVVGCGGSGDIPSTRIESAPSTLTPPSDTPLAPSSTVTPITSTATPTEIPAVGKDITIELPQGDPERGQALAEGFVKGLDGYSLGCSGCHLGSRPPGPKFVATGVLPVIGQRAWIRLAEEGYTAAATTAEQYLFESIVLPQAFEVEGVQWVEMPEDFGQRLTKQDVADLIAWMLSYEEG